MTELSLFPDQIYIEHLINRLWTGRELGQAAVMIGAGFSRNANRVSVSTPLFPLWEDLARIMFDGLYPLGDADRDEKKSRMLSGAGALRLAGEYQEVFGRTGLDDLLLQGIPDNNYSPGLLHEMLLSLPWSDVFTTNYDTLLERTLPRLYERKYDVVVNDSDIPGSMRPRIIKLHGSFPSNRPFIITEEDFRTYPRMFAPFVNTVQQSLMENVLCLIGFSGDDPNFLYWTGWVRDNLGANSPMIYLCGLLDLTHSQRQVLKKRNVIPIDLSPLFPKVDWPDAGLRHAKALEWLLITLLNSAPPNVMIWPESISETRWKPSPGLPVTSSPKKLSDLGKPYPSQLPVDKAELLELSKVWSKTRHEYPGWVILPKNNRENLWRYTKDWIEPLLNSLGNLEPPNELFLLYELNWRLERCHVPLINETDWANQGLPILNRYNPYPKIVEVNGAEVCADQETFKYLKWSQISECWTELFFSLARRARENQDENAFRSIMDRLKQVLIYNNDWVMRWHYEECLFHLYRQDQEKFRSTLNEWPQYYELPFWQIKRSLLFSEIGELKEAERIAEMALQEIRSRMRPFKIDLSLLSQEGCAILVLNLIKDNDLSDRDFIGQSHNRWEKLSNFHCDPWSEIDSFKAVFRGQKPKSKSGVETKKDFDVGRVIVHERTYNELSIVTYLPALSFLRILEDGALPIRCGYVTLLEKELAIGAKWIGTLNPIRTLENLIRAGEKEAIEEWFDRVRVATLTDKEVQYLSNTLISAQEIAIKLLMKKSARHTKAATYLKSKINLLSELVSRLAFRLPNDQLDGLFEQATKLYQHPLCREDHALYSSINVLFERTLFALPQSKVLAKIPVLLSLPIVSEGGFDVSFDTLWHEPMRSIRWLPTSSLSPEFDRSTWTVPITNLIRIVEHGSEKARKTAVARLVVIYSINALTDGEKERFAHALWSKVDPFTGLPSGTDFFNSFFLRLPEPTVGVVKAQLQRFALSTEFPCFGSLSNWDYQKSKATDHIRQLIYSSLPLFLDPNETSAKGIDWTEQEAVDLLQKVMNWWKLEKNHLQDEKSHFAQRFNEDFLPELKELLWITIFPKLRNTDVQHKDLAFGLLNEMEEAGLYLQQHTPFVLFIDPSQTNQVASKLRLKLNSPVPVEMRQAIIDLFYWIVYGYRQILPYPPIDLINEWINTIVKRQQPGLALAVGQMAVLIEKVPDALEPSQIHSLCIGLEYLLADTKLPTPEEREQLGSAHQTIPVEYRPEYREIATKLAHQVYSYFEKNKLDIPEILLTWKESSQEDVLPEVRRAWSLST